MSEADENKSPVIGRSPAYPFIPLDKALARAEALRKAVGKSDTRVVSAMHHWGYGEKSSGGIQTAAALKHFGLVEDTGSGKDRRIKLSDLALRILLDHRPDSQDRNLLVQRAALVPKMHQELWERWGRDLPVDAELRHYLLLDRNFSENGAEDLIKEYKATISYAGLLDSDMMPESEKDISPMEQVPQKETKSTLSPVFRDVFANAFNSPARFHGGGEVVPMESAVADNQIKVTMDGDRLQVTANVDVKGARKLLRAIRANLALLSDDDEEDAAN